MDIDLQADPAAKPDPAPMHPLVALTVVEWVGILFRVSFAAGLVAVGWALIALVVWATVINLWVGAA